jgi:hypothetical protein
MPTLKEQQGGYYALKGFIYQFDKSLLEILNNKTKDVQIEQIQDIGVEDFFIQVKYKETQSYADSKIRPAVLQLFKLFLENKNKKFKLYCYFKDNQSHIEILTIKKLNSILGSDSKSFSNDNKKEFLKQFTLEFSNNFEKQFVELIKLIKECFDLKSEDEAVVYHATLRSKLLEVAIHKDIKSRVINYSKIEGLIEKNGRIIFYSAYYKYLKADKYFKFLKKEYFTLKKPNMANKERLLIIEIDDSVKDGEIIQIVSNIKAKFFKKDTSPEPYICLLGVSQKRFNDLKQKIWDKEMTFFDGTHFSGDKFRIDDLVKAHNQKYNITFKFIHPDQLPLLIKKNVVDESFIFLIDNKDIKTDLEEFNEFYIGQTKNILKIIQ